MKKCSSCGTCGMIAFVLVIVGALNWGLVGVGHFVETNLNVVNLLVGTWPAVEAVVYILVGLSAVGMLFGCKKCGTCKSGE